MVWVVAITLTNTYFPQFELCAFRYTLCFEALWDFHLLSLSLSLSVYFIFYF